MGARLSPKEDDVERSSLVKNWYRNRPLNDQILNDDSDESCTNPIPKRSAENLPLEPEKLPRTTFIWYRIGIETLDKIVHK